MAELEYSRDGAVATILLNRPERKNAFTTTMLDLWTEALSEARDDPEVRSIVVTGAGDGFCAGVDLGRVYEEMGTKPLQMKEFLQKLVQRIPLLLEAIDKPVIAAVNGAAYGAGLDMALMCDMRFAARSARLCESYVRMGMVPGAGGAWFLSRLVGVPKALELFLGGEAVPADEALRIGMVNRVYDDGELLEATYAFAAKIATAPPVVTGMLKRVVYQSSRVDLHTALDLVSSHMGVVRSTPESEASFATLLESVVGNAPRP
jgi:enoyl-CoA hydratase/carnithine racemase